MPKANCVSNFCSDNARGYVTDFNLTRKYCTLFHRGDLRLNNVHTVCKNRAKNLK